MLILIIPMDRDQHERWLRAHNIILSVPSPHCKWYGTVHLVPGGSQGLKRPLLDAVIALLVVRQSSTYRFNVPVARNLLDRPNNEQRSTLLVMSTCPTYVRCRRRPQEKHAAIVIGTIVRRIRHAPMPTSVLLYQHPYVKDIVAPP